jgi:hypothetical protein
MSATADNTPGTGLVFQDIKGLSITIHVAPLEMLQNTPAGLVELVRRRADEALEFALKARRTQS